MPDHTRHVLSAGTLIGDEVRNDAGETLGKIEEIMIDLNTGNVAYAVLSFGGFMGLGDKLFAVPWQAMEIDLDEHEFVLDVDEERLKNAPGFNKDNWPESADPTFMQEVYAYYEVEPAYGI